MSPDITSPPPGDKIAPEDWIRGMFKAALFAILSQFWIKCFLPQLSDNSQSFSSSGPCEHVRDHAAPDTLIIGKL